MAQAAIGAGAVPRGRARRGSLRAQEARSAIWFLLPSFLGFSLFLLIPLVASAVLSFTNWQILAPPRFVGFANYARLFTVDPSFYQVVANTFLFTIEYLALNIVIALGLAVWITSLKAGRRLFRVIFFMPTFTPLVAVSIVWLLIFTPGGLADYVVDAASLPIPNFLLHPAWAMQAIVIVSLWAGVGYNLILFCAALEMVPKDYLDAATIDGANAWQRFWKVKLPMISPTIFFGTVMTAITSLQVFDQIFAMTRGGPGSATATLGFAIYQNGFNNYLMGYASAMSWVMFAIIMALTAFQFHVQRRWVHYDR